MLQRELAAQQPAGIQPEPLAPLSDEFDGDMLSERGGVLHDRYDWPNIGRGKAERAARGELAAVIAGSGWDAAREPDPP